MGGFWDPRLLRRIDFKVLPIILVLMAVSVMVISSSTLGHHSFSTEFFLTPLAKNQIRAFGVGLIAFFFFACMDYRRLREWTWIIYLVILVMLVGLYFTAPIHNVRRWYRFWFLPMDIQPSEYAKLVVVIALAWFLERRESKIGQMSTFWQASLIVFIPFALILKQPDLGTALVLVPTTLVMYYLVGVNRKAVIFLTVVGALVFGFVLSIYLGILSHEEMRGVVTHFLKDYQYERLNPNTYHQRAGQTAIALGRYFGSGFCKSDFMGRGWLPYAFTDSVFPAFTEEFGMVGAFFLLSIYFGLIYFGFHVTGVAKDHFGRLLSAGITVFIAVHVVINVGMMCGFLPITGVPLVLVSYGGSSVLVTMIALGILQSIYAGRFRF
ncbi:MAG: putative peptidoglycan glycosyltransferase FtsW [Chlamydiia bacterium]|nr:putative peptidoglycan glycosyltransferase FtsW [Chlamydiia bacterium]